MGEFQQFYLSSVSFIPCFREQQTERKKYYIYVMEPSITYANPAFSFFDALQISQKEKQSDIHWRSIATTNHQAIELHFRSIEDQRIISITINLPTLQFTFSSYVWHRYRKAFHKIDYPEHVNNEIVKSLLKRIGIKYNGRITYLSLRDRQENDKEGGLARAKG